MNSFTSVLIGGILTTFILICAGSILMDYMTVYGYNTNDSQYQEFRGNANLIGNLTASSNIILGEVNKTAGQTQGAAPYPPSWSDLRAWITIIKTVIDMTLQVIGMPIKLLTFAFHGLAVTFPTIIGLDSTAGLVLLVVGALILVSFIGYTIYVLIGRGGGGMGAV